MKIETRTFARRVNTPIGKSKDKLKKKAKPEPINFETLTKETQSAYSRTQQNTAQPSFTQDDRKIIKA